MSDTVTLGLTEATALSTAALTANGADAENARAVPLTFPLFKEAQ